MMKKAQTEAAIPNARTKPSAEYPAASIYGILARLFLLYIVCSLTISVLGGFIDFFLLSDDEHKIILQRGRRLQNQYVKKRHTRIGNEYSFPYSG